MTVRKEQTILAVLEESLERRTSEPPLGPTERDRIDIVAANFEEGTNTAAVHVLATLAVKKIMSPEQDVRLHKKQLTGGFSGRTLDRDHVTPFLLKHGLTPRPSSGWQTRSMQLDRPYDENYPGAISPAELKTAFLSLVHGMQTETGLARRLLAALLARLAEMRRSDHPARAQSHRRSKPARAGSRKGTGGRDAKAPGGDGRAAGRSLSVNDRKEPIRPAAALHPGPLDSRLGTRSTPGADAGEEAAPSKGSGMPRKRIEVEQATFLRMARFARPLEDTVDSVVNRALDALERHEEHSGENRDRRRDA